MDKKLLLDIFHVPARTFFEEQMSLFIKNYLNKYRIDYNEDKHGNIYNLSYPDKPILNSHMDTVQDENDSMLQHFAKIRGNVLSGYGTIGADDKCGIYLILDIIRERKVNFLFTVEEEIGCVGAGHFVAENNIRSFPYSLTLDRFGSSDIICYNNEYGTLKFQNDLSAVGKKFGYNPAKGVLSDADQISDQLSCANLSVGYYNHHTKTEFVLVNELEVARNYVLDIIDNLKENYAAPKKISGSTGNYGMFDDMYINFDEENICFVTKRRSKNLFYIPSIDKYVSPAGARALLEDLQNSEAVYANDNNDDDDDEDEMNSQDFYELYGEM